MTTIYNYDAKSGAYTCESEAYPDPASLDAPLLPAFATRSAPPKHAERQWPFWRDGIWILLPDFRGVKLYRTSNGDEAYANEPGVLPEALGLTEQPRPGPEYAWKGDAWKIDDAYIRAHKLRQKETEFFNELKRVSAITNALVEKGQAQEDRFRLQAELDLWFDYERSLVRYRDSKDFPDLEWPSAPTEALINARAEAAKQAYAQALARSKAEQDERRRKEEEWIRQWAEAEKQRRQEEEKHENDKDDKKVPPTDQVR